MADTQYHKLTVFTLTRIKTCWGNWEVVRATVEIQWNTCIWANYNNSLTWIKAIWGWFPLLTMIPVRSQWGRYNLPRCISSTCMTWTLCLITWTMIERLRKPIMWHSSEKHGLSHWRCVEREVSTEKNIRPTWTKIWRFPKIVVPLNQQFFWDAPL